MKKVLIFSLAYLPKHVGGAEVSIKEITDRISDIEFHMITNRFDSTLPREERIWNVLVHRIGLVTSNPTMSDLRKFPLNLNKPLFQFLAALKAQQLHWKYGYDATWAMMAHSCGVPAALFKTFNPGVKYLLNLQEGDPPEYIERTMLPVWPLFSRAFTTADVVTVLSTFLGTWARRRGFAGPLEVVPNAVNVRRFDAAVAESELEKVRHSIGKKDGDVLLITTSRLVKKNAVDDVIRALPLMPGQVVFVVVGTGPDETMLKQLAAELGVADRVRFLGHVEQEVMPSYLKASDIFIRPSRSEGFGISFVEAMAAGLPVIATQEGGISDFLFDAMRNPDKETTGWAVDADAPDQIAKAVSAIIANPGEVTRVTAHAVHMVRAKYDWEIIARQTHAILGALISGGSSESIVERALRIAIIAHAGQRRKMRGDDFISHPKAVAALVKSYGFSDAVVAAALLHDVLEDTTYSADEMRAEFGPAVLATVEALSEDKSLSWKDRKSAYIASVRVASNEVKAVSAADKIHNYSSIISDYTVAGPAVWEKFGGGREGQIGFADDMLAMLCESWQHPLVEKLARVVAELKTLE